ncbi:unnamed protein product [Hyaloperonospora brassicae]|uniref:RxLR effector candidate protein n=1 Tax=Hyaloperonospora brassicae TaxID=162125 RepID=A0AAV0TY08_HYABA|nr:unnamed protein product [Hyaloperonospora brassicae]
MLSIYCVDLNGSFLSQAQCTQLLVLQGSQLVLLLLCMNRVLHLARKSIGTSSSWNEVDVMLLVMQSVVVAAAMVSSVEIARAATLYPLSASFVVGASVAAAMWFFYAVQNVYEFLQHEASCKLVTLFVVLCAVEELVKNMGTSQLEVQMMVLVRYKAIISIVVAGLAVVRTLMCRQRGKRANGENADQGLQATKTAMESPLDRVGWLSQLSLSWISPTIALGKARRLEMDDIPNLPAQDKTSVAASKFKKELQHEFSSYRPSKRSFLRVAWRLYGTDVILFAVWSTMNKAVGLVSPLLLKLFLDWAAASNSSFSTGYYLAAAMMARSVISAVSGTQFNLAWKRFDLRVRAGLVSAIYARTLQLSGESKRQAGGLGHITNLISVDVGRIVSIPGTIFDMVLIPVEIAVAFVLLSKAVSVSFVAGVAVLAIMLPLQTALGRKIQHVTADMMRFRDERVGLVAESLKAIRTLKLLGWVTARLDMMSKSRSLELGRLRVRKYLDAFCVFFWASTPVIVQVSVFAAAVFSGRDISAADAFTAIALLDRLVFPMNYLPWIVNSFLEARVSALRIRGFLFDKEDNACTAEGLSRSHQPQSAVSPTGEANKYVVSIRDCEFGWGGTKTSVVEAEDSDVFTADTPLLVEGSAPSSSVEPASHHFALRIAELELQRGSTYVVCGPVGAGKSSLLLALLDQMPKQSNPAGVYRREQSLRCAYSPQSPWLFRGNVYSNITLCSESDADCGEGENGADSDRVERVLRICELDVDLRHMKPPYNVAESGNNFSGGQRARINLARALYQRADLYLLDDPFSGLDATTASKVITNCFTSSSSIFPPNATVVVVTHSLHLLSLLPTDVRVVVMDEGCIVEQGTCDALKAQDPPSHLTTLLKQSPSNETFDGSASCVPPAATIEENEHTGSVDDVAEDESTSMEEDDEGRESGVVGWHIWKAYSLDVGWALSAIIMLFVVGMQISRNSLDWWIAVYTNGRHSITPREFAMILLYIAGTNIVFVFFRSFLFAYGGLRAARATYHKLIQSVFAASLRFFEQTPVGRVLNRLSGDTYAVDESLPFTLNIFLKDAADVVGALVILFYGNRFVVLLLVPLILVYFHLQRDYRPSSRHLKRLDATTQSSLLATITDTLNGLTIIRAAGRQRQYYLVYEARLNHNQRVAFLSSTTNAWFGLRLDMLGVCVTSFVVVFAVADFGLTGEANPGILGLTLTYALPIVGKLNAILNSFVHTERQMIAVERVKEYTELESEEDIVGVGSTAKARDVPHSWPAAGHISIVALTVTYATPANDIRHRNTFGSTDIASSRVVAPALNHVTCDIPAGQKLGICGRTGAGKSTLLNTLFRAVPWERSGSIRIDNLPLDSIRLQDIRSRLTYIPQDVVLFSGTVRSNLDPDGVLGDERLWTVLRKCGGLATAVAKLDRGLDTVIEGGDNEHAVFSQGQAQLLCIARALLRPSKVLCIDEATASLDCETERVISETIASEFSTSTVIMVAHRVQTIMQCDRVLLLDSGCLVESGDPKELVRNPQSLLSRLVDSSTGESLLPL